MTLRAGRAHAEADGANELQVKFESPEVGGVKLVKTYTFKRGDYVIGVKHEVVNESARAGHRRACTCSWCATATPPPGESSFYFTFTGPAIYTDAQQVPEDRVQGHREARATEKPDHTIECRRRLGRDGAALLRLGLADRGRRPKQPREFFTGKACNRRPPTTSTRSACSCRWARSRPARPRPSTRSSSSARRKRTSSPRSRRGLELVKDYGIFTILAKPLFWLLTQLHKILGNWGWSIVGAGRAAEDRVLLAQRQAPTARWPR